MTLDPEIRELSPQPAVTEVAVTDADGIPSVVDAAFPGSSAASRNSGSSPPARPSSATCGPGRRWSSNSESR